MRDKKRKVKDENFYSIFGWMTNPDAMNLKGLELKVYAIIYTMTQHVNKFDGSLQYLAEFTGSTERGIKKALAKLVEKGYLVKKQKSYNRFEYTAVVVKKNNGEHSSSMGNTVPHNGEHSSSWMGNTVPHDGEQSSPNNIVILENEINSDMREGKATPIKQKYGKYENVKLTRDEVVELNDKFGFQTIKEYIKKLDEYIETSGKKYNNHALVISNWINEDKDKKQSSGTKKNQFNNFAQRQDTDFDALEKKLTGGAG